MTTKNKIEFQFFPFPTEMSDLILKLNLPASALKVLIFIYRMTFGYNRDEVILTRLQIAENCNFPNLQTVNRAVKILVNHGLISKGIKFDSPTYKPSIKFDSNSIKFDSGSIKFDSGGIKFDSPLYSIFTEKKLKKRKTESVRERPAPANGSAGFEGEDEKEVDDISVRYPNKWSKKPMNGKEYIDLCEIFGERQVKIASDDMIDHALGNGIVYESEYHRLKKWLTDNKRRNI